MIRVAVWGTGNVGRAAIRMVDGHPELELAAVVVSSDAKVGQDAGDLAQLGRTTGVVATKDLPNVDAVVYAASADFRPDEALADILQALRSGAAVVTPGIYALYDPPSAPRALVEPVEAACKEGGSAFFANGIDPGWGNDLLPLLASGFVSEWSQLRAQEIFDYSGYPVAFAIYDVFGFGRPLDHTPILALPGVQGTTWGPPVRMVADACLLYTSDAADE